VEEINAAMRITVSRPVNGISVTGDEYILGEDGKPLGFDSAREAVIYLSDRNLTIGDLRELDFNVEETDERTRTA
jgi:hypothetical protein